MSCTATSRTATGHWNRHLEGSYAVADDLRTVDGLGAEWLYVDHGADEIVVVRPLQPAVDALDPARARHHARRPLPGGGGRPRCPRTCSASGPRRAGDAHRRRPRLVPAPHRVVPALPRRAGSRSLYTVRTAQVASKRDALRWAMMHGDPRWRPLLQQVQADRDRGFDPDDEPRAGSLDEARDFAAYVAAVA